MSEETKDILWSLFAGALFAACVVVFSAFVNRAKGDTLVYFHSDQCIPCQKTQPEVEKVKKAGYLVADVDVDKYPNVARDYRVYRIPSIVMVAETPSGNIELGRIVGRTTYPEIVSLAERPIISSARRAVHNSLVFVFGWPYTPPY